MKTLRSKFIFWICLLFILMGVLIFVPLSIILPEKISSQILKRDIKIAQYLSREVQELLLIDNRVALKLVLEDRLGNSGDAIYIFIRGQDGRIVSSTFKGGFPKGLVKMNEPGQNLYRVKEFLANGKRVYDISIPLFQGELGSLHLGVSLESSKTEIAEFAKINYYMATVIFIGLGVGILIFALLGLFLSNRIIKLKDFATKIGSGNLNGTIDIKSKDEIGALAAAFNEMAAHLREKIQEIKRLNIIEERNRIALDLHDGCAQNIASIIKGIELCEKLFRIDSSRAFEELESLKESTKAILDKTRQVIFDLKLPADADFCLLANVKNYISSYQKQNDINVKFSASGPINDISSGKSKQIFYIIGEALINVKKHSLAKNVQLSLTRDRNDELAVDIKDDGKGFDIQKAESSAVTCGRWGLTGMRQRTASLGGRLVITSIPNQGTEVNITIPLKERAL